MKIIANENVFEPIIEFLENEGHEIINVRTNGLSGSTDDRIFNLAVSKNLVIVTMDKDFSRMIRFPPDKCGGIIVIKLYRMTIDSVTQLFKRYFKSLDLNKIQHKLVIITPEGIRIRGKDIN